MTIKKILFILLGLSVCFVFVAPSIQAQTSPGDLDTNFGTSGYRLIENGIEDLAVTYTDVQHQDDGKILVSGYYDTGDGHSDMLLMRFDEDGQLDASFATSGVYTVNMSGLCAGQDPNHYPGNDEAHAIAIQNLAGGDKIIVAGHCFRFVDTDIFVARFNLDGTLDTSFDGDGLQFISPDDNGAYAADVKVYPAASSSYANFIAVAGKVYDPIYSNVYETAYDFLAIRLEENGTLDTGFNGVGYSKLDLSGGNEFAETLDVRLNGQMYLAGARYLPPSGPAYTDIGLVKYTADGTLDTTFDGNGIVLSGISSVMAVGDKDAFKSVDFKSGKIYVAGLSQSGVDKDYIISRYTGQGALDTGFSTDGKEVTDFGQSYDEAQAIKVLKNGDVLISGASKNGTIDGSGTIGLALYDSAGSFQTDFNAMGFTTYSPTYVMGKGAVTDMSLDGGDRVVILAGRNLLRFIVTHDIDQDGDGETIADGDCDDQNGAINTSATESCDGVDNDCDGAIDEAGATGETTWYEDGDNDQFGLTTSTIQACDQPAGYTAQDGDCNDGNNNFYPGAPELCDGFDQDCDGETFDNDSSNATVYYRDSDADTFGDANVAQTQCLGVPVGYVADSSDCDDTNAATHTNATESCDGIDNDCDGEIDELGAIGETEWYLDSDQDGYGDSSQKQVACLAPLNHVSNKTDCDDHSNGVHPNQTEICGDGIDQDCSGADQLCEADTANEEQDSGILEESAESNGQSSQENESSEETVANTRQDEGNMGSAHNAGSSASGCSLSQKASLSFSNSSVWLLMGLMLLILRVNTLKVKS